MPRRVRWTRFAGTPLPPNTRLITRVTRYGNPFRVCAHRDQVQAVDQFTRFLPTRTVRPAWLCCGDLSRVLIAAERYPSAEQIRRELAGYDLACECRPGTPCHGDLLLTLANTTPVPIRTPEREND